jgi:hypothetical protein
MKRLAVATAAVALVAATAVFGGGHAAAGLGGVRLNEMQVIGSHNSYHIEPEYAADLNITELMYTHAPLQQQFSEQGVRQIELDVYADPDGSMWRPIGVPGFKVLHIAHVDTLATCETLVACLGEVKAWSDAHGEHMPIAVLIELKDAIDLPGVMPEPIPIGTDLLHDLDDEIRSVFPEDSLLTPDDVRGSASTLEDAILGDGWPEIDDVRGQTMVMLDNKRNEYVVGNPSLEGRAAFTPSSPGQDDAAFIKQNDPLGANTALIQGYVDAGYMVRTRADEPTFNARMNDTTQRDAALESGAQWVSTDFPVVELSARWGTDYVARIPGGTPARCNPVNAPEGCENTDIENLPPDVTNTTPPPTSSSTSTSSSGTGGRATPRFTG